MWGVVLAFVLGPNFIIGLQFEISLDAAESDHHPKNAGTAPNIDLCTEFHVDHVWV